MYNGRRADGNTKLAVNVPLWNRKLKRNRIYGQGVSKAFDELT